MSKAIRMNASTKNELNLLTAYHGYGHVGEVLKHGFDALHGDKITELPAKLTESIDKMYYGYGKDRNKVMKVWNGEIRFSANHLSKWTADNFNINFATEYRDRETGDFVSKDYGTYGLSKETFEEYFDIKLDAQELWDAGLKPYMAWLIGQFELENYNNYSTPTRLFRLAQWMRVSNIYKRQGSGLFSKRRSPTSAEHIVIREPSTDRNGNRCIRGVESDYGRKPFMSLSFDGAHITMLKQLGKLMQQVNEASRGVQHGSRRNQHDLDNLKSYETSLKIFQDHYNNTKQALLDRGHDTVEEAIEAEKKMVAEVEEYLKNIPHADAVGLRSTPEVYHGGLLGNKLQGHQSQIDSYTRYIADVKQKIAGYDDELITLEFKVAKRKMIRFLITNGIKSDDGGEEE